MNGRKRIELHASSEQPRRRWTLARRDELADIWQREDGYKVHVWVTPANGVRQAQLVSPSGTSRGLPWGRHGRVSAGKADQVIDWITDPTAHLRPPANHCARCGDPTTRNGRGELLHSQFMSKAYDHKAEDYPAQEEVTR